MSRVKQVMQRWMQARQWSRQDDVRRAKRLILGIGTGRCGSSSLAHLLGTQPGCIATHEAYPVLAWQGDDQLALQKINALAGRDAPVAADVAWFYLPYIPAILQQNPDARVICLERPRQEVIDSFLRKLGNGVNHWTTSQDRRVHRLDDCFPKYDSRLPLPEAIGRYWDDYRDRVANLCHNFPKQVGCWPMTAALNEEPVLRSLLQFAGFATPVVKELGTRRNAA